ncbi:unnamed protein product [Cyprideis torosa]|uniref:Uncharacterized protein n=1 Tax=Cyprideis torosa TaxID=163714 RepID=A0A7R8W4S1_9CRUS|nr:unnamed protein product [Cyprideis torosa]CAG0883468.1 unnamed protein product [Cyprideis torosa]
MAASRTVVKDKALALVDPVLLDQRRLSLRHRPILLASPRLPSSLGSQEVDAGWFMFQSVLADLLNRIPLRVQRRKGHTRETSKTERGVESNVLFPVTQSSAFSMVLNIEGPKTPLVSKASGSKRWHSARMRYFVLFSPSAASSADDGCMALEMMMLRGAKESTHVASQTKLRPLEKGRMVIPPGRLSSSLSSPIGSNENGIPVDFWMARSITRPSVQNDVGRASASASLQETACCPRASIEFAHLPFRSRRSGPIWTLKQTG